MRLLVIIPMIALALAGCKPAAEPTAEVATAREVAAKPGFAAKDGKLVLPAVKGNPGAAYFTIFNGNQATATITAVAIAGAGTAEMHRSSRDSMAKLDSVAIKPTWTERFIPGARHVMAFDLDPELAPGGETKMTLTFADGATYAVPLKIEAAGMALDHGDMH